MKLTTCGSVSVIASCAGSSDREIPSEVQKILPAATEATSTSEDLVKESLVVADIPVVNTAVKHNNRIRIGLATGNAFVGRQKAAVTSAIQSYTKANSGVEVELVDLPVGGAWGPSFRTAFVDAIKSSFADGDIPDLVVFPTRAILADVHQAGLIKPIDRFLAQTGFDIADYHPLARKIIEFDGHIWALPWAMTPTVMWWSPALFETAGVKPPTDDPWSRDQLGLAMSQLVMRADSEGKGGRWGFYANLDAAINFIWQDGADIVTDNGDVVIDTVEAHSAVRYLQSLVHSLKVAPPYSRGIPRAGRTESGIIVDGQAIGLMFGPAKLLGQRNNAGAVGMSLAPVPHGLQSATRGSMDGMLSLMSGGGNEGESFEALVWLAKDLESKIPFPVRKGSTIQDIMDVQPNLNSLESASVMNGLQISRDIQGKDFLQVRQIFNSQVVRPVVEEGLDPEEACANAALMISQIEEVLNE